MNQRLPSNKPVPVRLKRSFSETLSDMRKTVRAVRPLLWRALKSGQLFRPACKLLPPNPDILCEYDVKIPMKEGFSLTANVFRSKSSAASGEKVPVIMCAHPYDNHLIPALGKTPMNGPPQQYRLIPQHGTPAFSTLTSWESPDPNFWVPAGYAVVNLNLPGFANSEGAPSIFSSDQGKCYYEAIEWIAKRPWCTGAIGLNGVSFLAISQYHVAACQAYGGAPPSLKCISPWEGFVDVYREFLCAGGIEDEGFLPFWWLTEVKHTVNGGPEKLIEQEGLQIPDILKIHPFFDAFWESKRPKIEDIDVPLLVCGSFSDHGLHTMGSCSVFTQARSKHKWLYTHRTGKWDAYYSDEVQQLTKAFFDHFVKGEDNGFTERAPVRLEVRKDIDTIYEIRDEYEWPLARTLYTPLYLDHAQGTLSAEPIESAKERSYSSKKGRAVYTWRFDEETEISGYIKLKLWVEVRPLSPKSQQPEDMAIFAAIKKLDKTGKELPFFGSVGNHNDSITRGSLRVSRRELDLEKSTAWQPILKGTTHQPLRSGEIVPVEIGLYPSSTFFEAGESLQLLLSSDEIIPSPPYVKNVSFNQGIHVFHSGGDYDAYVMLPSIPKPDASAH